MKKVPLQKRWKSLGLYLACGCSLFFGGWMCAIAVWNHELATGVMICELFLLVALLAFMSARRSWEAETKAFYTSELERCRRIADTQPIKWGWGTPDPKPWGCLLTEQAEGADWYCDKCPVSEECPYEHKEWSK